MFQLVDKPSSSSAPDVDEVDQAASWKHTDHIEYPHFDTSKITTADIQQEIWESVKTLIPTLYEEKEVHERATFSLRTHDLWYGPRLRQYCGGQKCTLEKVLRESSWELARFEDETLYVEGVWADQHLPKYRRSPYVEESPPPAAATATATAASRNEDEDVRVVCRWL